MELRKKNLHMMQKKSEAQNQITFDEDYNVPDQKADIGQRLIRKIPMRMKMVLRRHMDSRAITEMNIRTRTLRQRNHMRMRAYTPRLP